MNEILLCKSFLMLERQVVHLPREVPGTSRFDGFGRVCACGCRQLTSGKLRKAKPWHSLAHGDDCTAQRYFGNLSFGDNLARSTESLTQDFLDMA